jgi:hypothetical protein
MTSPETTLKKDTASPVWASFAVLVVTNAVLSYSSFSIAVKGLWFLLGVLLPFYHLFRTPFERPAQTPSHPGLRPYLLLGALAILSRLLFLTTYQPFPGGDEGMHGFLAQGLIPHWNWTFFYTCAEHPPLLIWSIALVLRWTNEPFVALWLVPAISTLLGWGLLTAAARRFLPSKEAFLFSFLAALSFWPLYSSRFCHQGPLTLPFLGALAYAFARSETTTGRPRLLWSSAAGLFLGLGTLTFTAWLVAIPVAFIFAATRARSRRDTESQTAFFLSFLTGFLLGASPFLLAVVREGYGQHLYSVSTLGSWSEETQKRLVGLSYGTAIFWKGLVPTGAYGPPLGGLLNPLLGAACLAGLAQTLRRFFEARSFWLLLAFLAGLLPGLLSTDYVEMFRIVLVQPILILLAVVGLASLTATLPRQAQGRFLALFLVLSTLLDLFLFVRPVLDRRRNAPLSPSLGAYQTFSEMARRSGPGYVFTDFSPLAHNHALSSTVYSFNAATNPLFMGRDRTWVGLATQPGYLPFLQKRFPNAHWRTFEGIPGDPPRLVALLPFNEGNRAEMTRWLTAHRFFHEQQLIVENVFASRKKYSAAVSHLRAGASLVQGDRFLESVYGEWAAQYYWDPRDEGNIGYLKGALDRGYPARQLAEQLIDLLERQGRSEEAEKVKREYLIQEAGKNKTPSLP